MGRFFLIFCIFIFWLLRLGLEVPDDLALASSSTIKYQQDNVVIDSRVHIGLLGLKAYGGIRVDDYKTYGMNMSFHMGYNQMVSLFRFDFDYYTLISMKDSMIATEEYGFKGSVGCILIF